ncbi:MAG TPA: tetraacyldisaccharide 4'-kinase [Polyangiaceae bacterium]|nr:tetraacyldisaccharide 4'-kinase [Polyangiaceae bacterium]
MGPARLRAAAADALERGALRSPLTDALSRGWAALARPIRPVELPDGTAVFGVSGPTLGGSYKTPTAIALAAALAARGAPVAVVSHGYRARARAPRVVLPTDSVSDVGDDALAAARVLSPLGVPVLCGGSRERALFAGASLAPNLVVDGLLQAAPRRLAASLLVVSAEAPWGADQCPPAGDLRASRSRLVAASDVTVHVEDGAPDGCTGTDAAARDVRARLSLDLRDSASGRPLSLEELRGKPIGLVAAVARPGRIRTTLGRIGVRIAEERLFPDHATPRERTVRARRPAVAAWLATEKCATKLGTTFEGAPVLVLAGRVVLPDALVDGVHERCRVF